MNEAESLLLRHWDMAAAAVSLCEGGVDNRNYRVRTPQGGYILTRLLHLSAEQLRPVVLLLKQLRTAGLPVPEVVPTRTGEDMALHDGQPVLLQTCLSGAPASEELEISIQQCRQAGEILAQLHLAAPAPGELFGEDLLALAPALAEEYLPALPFAQQQLCERELKVLRQLGGDLPGGVIHNDLFCDNMLFDRGKISGLLDFYSSRNGFYATDVAMALLDWAWDPVNYRFAVSRAEAFLGAYEALRPLSKAERMSLPDRLRAVALAVWLFRIRRGRAGRELPQERRPEDMVQRLTAVPLLLGDTGIFR